MNSSNRILCIGANALSVCMDEIRGAIDLASPDFIRIDAPCSADDIDHWTHQMRCAPLEDMCRHGLIVNAHALSEVALSRLLDLLEESTARIWVASLAMLPDTVHSRMHLRIVGGETEDEWGQILHACQKNLLGSNSERAWEEWYYVCKLYKYFMAGLPGCAVKAKQFAVTRP